jgi:hypothetical protein
VTVSEKFAPKQLGGNFYSVIAALHRFGFRGALGPLIFAFASKFVDENDQSFGALHVHAADDELS